MRDLYDGHQAAARLDLSIRPEFGVRIPFIEGSGQHRFDGSLGVQLGNRCLPSMQITDHRYNHWGQRNPYNNGTDYGMKRHEHCHDRQVFRRNDWNRHRPLNTFFDSRPPERFHDIPRLQDRPWIDDRSQCTFRGGDRYTHSQFRLNTPRLDMQVGSGPRDMTYHQLRGYQRPPYPCPEVHPTCRLMQPRQEAPQYYSPQNNTMRRISYTPDAVRNQSEQNYRPQPAVYQPEQQNFRPQPAVYQPEQQNFRPQPAVYQPDRQSYQPEQPFQPNKQVSSPQTSDAFVDRVIGNISSHEGNFTSINKNDAGYGISIGIRQWNQKAGELPVLMKAWNRQDSQKFHQIFGPYAEQLLNDKWVRSYDMAHDEQFMSRMKTALADKEFQQVQMSESRSFVKRNIDLAHSYGFHSELGVALVCDMVNHMGSGGTEKAMQKIGLVKGGQIADERRAVERLSSVRPNGKMYYAMLDKKFSDRNAAAGSNQYVDRNPNVALA